MVGHNRTYGWFIAPTIVVLMALTVVPVILLFTFSFTKWNLSVQNSFEFAGFGNFVRMFTDDRAVNSIKISLYYIVVNTGAQILIGFIVAYVLFLGKRGTKVLRPILLIPMLTPPVVVGLCWRVLFTPGLGGINYFIGLIGIHGPDWLAKPTSALIGVSIASVWEWTPFVMLVLLAGLESLPKDPIEAAVIDGTSALQRLMWVILPLLRPVILVVVILRVIDALGILPVVFMMTGGGPNYATEAINLYAYSAGFSYLDIAYASTLLVTFIFIILLVSISFLKSSLRRA